MKVYILLGLTIMFLMSACKKELDIEYHDIEPLTVIEGVLTPDGVKVAITLTTPMNEPMNRTRLTDAVVTLSDLTAGESYALVVDNDGYFADNVGGIVGHDYALKVERGSDVFEAQTTMYAPTEIVDLVFNWIKMPYDHVAVLQGQFSDVSQCDDYYWVKIFRNGKIYRWIDMNDSGDVGGVLTFVTMTTRKDIDKEDDDDVLFDGDEISVSISMISHRMHGYLEALQNDSSGPAMFVGGRCLGYFMATSPVSKSIIFHPDEIPIFE